MRDALLRLAPPGADEERLSEGIADGDGGLARWYYCLDRLSRLGLLCYSLHADGACLSTLLPVSPAFAVQLSRRSLIGRHVLSRFAYLRRDGCECVLESGMAHARIIVHDARTAAVIGRLCSPVTLDKLVGEVPTLSAEAHERLLALLARSGMLQTLDEAGAAPEDIDPATQTWAFHDLVFHARSRKGRTDAPYGGTYRFAGQSGPPPALMEPPPGETVELFRPDLARLRRDDPTLSQVLEERASDRAFDSARPISATQLGEFLFRVARARDHRQVELATPAGPQRMDMVGRPYPAGGGMYELELYLAIQACADLEAGLHYYDPARHRLVRLSGVTANLTALLADAAGAACIPPDELQVLIILAARYPRLAWKYESIAYSLVLKHVGVLYQSMYLAATAMGLGPCAVGGGDADLFARAAGTKYTAVTSVGEFLLGSRFKKVSP